jgi:hypothetical protein
MMTERRSVEKTMRDIRRRTRKKYSSEEKIRIVLEGMRMTRRPRFVTVSVTSRLS